jgi:hypothetical protein
MKSVRILALPIWGLFLASGAAIGADAPPDAVSRIPRLLADARELEGIPFGEVVREATGYRVIPVNARQDSERIQQVAAAMDRTLRVLNAPGHPMQSAGRINEASRFIEDELHKQLNQVPGWKCTIPGSEDGVGHRAGYPDLRLDTPEGVIYIDPKLLAPGSESSSLRTFYYEPRTLTNKIRSDATHLLIGVTHNGSDTEPLQFRSWKIVDVSALPVRLKAEFQASNREIYSAGRIIAESGSQGITK